ncbi:hypothetical protein [uncultured Ruegeria sp.]|uniref:hypothetical protein n=1 Tax=uncultured Ruegeria sp. TaxID=259304 RepID=UPI00262289D3|nr:hypothetical protein [uncultured Ruegeria sp.]
MASFGAQLQAFAEKTDNKLQDVDRAFKLELFGMIVGRTRVADPSTWKRPDPDYLGGTMRGNWQVTTDVPAQTFIEGQRNTSFALPADEAGKIEPFSSTWLSNNTPYVLVWEETDAMVGASLADARRLLAEAVADAGD